MPFHSISDDEGPDAGIFVSGPALCEQTGIFSFVIYADEILVVDIGTMKIICSHITETESLAAGGHDHTGHDLIVGLLGFAVTAAAGD